LLNFIRLRMGFDCGRQKILSTRPSRTDTSWCACPGRCPSSPLVHRHLNEPLEQICSFQTCAAIPFRGATLQRGGDSAPLPSCGEGLVLPQGWVGPAGRIRPESSQSRECNWTAGSTHRLGCRRRACQEQTAIAPFLARQSFPGWRARRPFCPRVEPILDSRSVRPLQDKRPEPVLGEARRRSPWRIWWMPSPPPSRRCRRH
jgi:hypothetical protein